ncbi:MAG: DsbA family protein [Burkholderiales bacterium]|nr:DsbA family protein [Burkholderiales bacterium]
MNHDNPLHLIAYTDYKSPYAFVATDPIRALAMQYPVSLEWRPYTLRIAEFLGTVEERSERAWRKVRYAYMDARRLANRRGLILKGPRRIYSAELASIGLLFSQDHGFFDAYHASTFERFWRHDRDIDSIEDMCHHIQQQAEAQGVFGVPTLVFGGELFWGGDRLDMVREAIEGYLLAKVPPRGAAR